MRKCPGSDLRGVIRKKSREKSREMSRANTRPRSYLPEKAGLLFLTLILALICDKKPRKPRFEQNKDHGTMASVRIFKPLILLK